MASAIRFTSSKKLRQGQQGAQRNAAINILWRRVHQIELGRVLKHLCYAGIPPNGCDGQAHPHVERLFWIGIHGVLQQVLAVLVVLGVLAVDVELAHGAYQGLCAVDDVLVDGEAVHGELLLRVAILVDDLHLLDDGRLAALAGACWVAR